MIGWPGMSIPGLFCVKFYRNLKMYLHNSKRRCIFEGSNKQKAMSRISKKDVNEVIENLKKGVQYRNETSGISYSMGATFIKFTKNGEMKFFANIESFARDIARFIKRGY